MTTRIILLIPLIALLAACGGSDSSPNGTVSVMIADDLTQSYSEVWVNVRSIKASNNSQSVTLYQDATGQTYNLRQLANIGALVDARSIPTGTYNQFEIEMANVITLVDPVGAVTNATFDKTGNSSFKITVPGTLTVGANQLTTLALDFNLQQFTYDAAANTVTPVVVQKDPGTLNQVITTIHGEIESVTSSTQFVLDPTGSGRHLTVTLGNNASVTNTATGVVSSDTSGLSVNMHVSVSGTYDAATLTITASRVQSSNSSLNLAHEVEGRVQSVSGGSLSIDIHEASFMPGVNSMTIDVSNAAFSHGALNQLAAGQKVEIKGSWDGTIFTAVVVEIEGYSSNSGSHTYVDDYAEIKGEVTAVNSKELTLTVQERDNVSGINIGDSVTIDSSNSWIEHGNSSCLVVGARIEAKGPMTATTTMSANKIDIESGCS